MGFTQRGALPYGVLCFHCLVMAASGDSFDFAQLATFGTSRITLDKAEMPNVVHSLQYHYGLEDRIRVLLNQIDIDLDAKETPNPQAHSERNQNDTWTTAAVGNPATTNLQDEATKITAVQHMQPEGTSSFNHELEMAPFRQMPSSIVGLLGAMTKYSEAPEPHISTDATELSVSSASNPETKHPRVEEILQFLETEVRRRFKNSQAANRRAKPFAKPKRKERRCNPTEAHPYGYSSISMIKEIFC